MQEETQVTETPKPSRPLDDIKSDYSKMCGLLGECTYQIEVATHESKQIMNSLFALNKEAAALDQEKKEIAAKNQELDDKRAAKKAKKSGSNV